MRPVHTHSTLPQQNFNPHSIWKIYFLSLNNYQRYFTNFTFEKIITQKPIFPSTSYFLSLILKTYNIPQLEISPYISHFSLSPPIAFITSLSLLPFWFRLSHSEHLRKGASAGGTGFLPSLPSFPARSPCAARG